MRKADKPEVDLWIVAHSFFFFFYIYILKKINFFFSIAVIPCEKFGSLFLGIARLQQPQEQRYPFLTVHAVFSCVQTKVRLPVLWIFHVRTDVNARDCTRGLCGHRKRVCTESWLWEKNSSSHRGIEPDSAACRSGALTSELLPRPLLCSSTTALCEMGPAAQSAPSPH